MSIPPRHRDSLASLRCDLAGLTASLALLRAERALRRKYRSDQPRAPAGSPDGGRWVADGGGDQPSLGARWTSGGGDLAGGTTTLPEVVDEDGSRVLTIRVRPNADVDWDEQHRVVTPDGTSTLFENSGFTQTIRDGETGEILARSRLTREGAVPEAFVQAAKGPGLPGRGPQTLEAAGTLLAYLLGRGGQDGIPIFAAPATEYRPGQGEDAYPIWVGAVGQRDLDAACPRNGEVQALADEMAARVKASGGYTSRQDFGNKVHLLIAQEINGRRDPYFVAEKSYDLTDDLNPRYGAQGTVRIDILERSTPTTVCVYDHKTGKAVLTPSRVFDIMRKVQHHYPEAQRLIMIEIRPNE